MPFKSIKQRRFLFKFHPDIAKRWAKYPTKGKLPLRVTSTKKLTKKKGKSNARRRRGKKG